MMNQIATDIVVSKALKDAKESKVRKNHIQLEDEPETKDFSENESINSEEEEILRSMREKIGGSLGVRDEKGG